MTRGPLAEDQNVAAAPVQRLCNEIQLFDLCYLERCSFKKGNFCTKAELLAAFERISDAEMVRPEVFLSEALEEGDEAYDDECDEAYEADEFGDEAGYDDE